MSAGSERPKSQPRGELLRKEAHEHRGLAKFFASHQAVVIDRDVSIRRFVASQLRNIPLLAVAKVGDDAKLHRFGRLDDNRLARSYLKPHQRGNFGRRT